MRLVAGLVAALLLPPALPAQDSPATLTVFAASSLTDAFRAAGLEFERTHPGTRVRFNFAGSQQLATQVELGAEADVLAAADDNYMNRLHQGGFLASAPSYVTATRLVIIAARNPDVLVRAFRDLARPGLRLVLAGPAVPAGAYSRQVIARLAALPGMQPGYEARVLANVVSHEGSVRGVLGKVLLGEADAGMVYESDLHAIEPGRVTRIEIPAAANLEARYPVAALRESRHPALAGRFVAFLRSEAGQRVLARHGFLRVE